MATKMTCNSCRLHFESSEEQKLHYKSELHQHNLKRKVAGFPPISQEMFDQRLEAMQAEEAKAEEATTKLLCTLCNKSFSSEKAFETHQSSKKHREKLADSDGSEVKVTIKKTVKTPLTTAALTTKSEKESKTETEDSGVGITTTTTTTVEKAEEDGDWEDEEVDQDAIELDEEAYVKKKLENAQRLALEDCLFCSLKSPDFKSNVDHMRSAHSFFVPDVEYLKDPQGLVRYLGEKLSVGNVCLWCNGKGKTFHSLEGVRNHMHSTGHWKMLYAGNEEEYEEFYDFSAILEDVDENDTGGYELTETGELSLPNGKIIGHRMYARYYKQAAPRHEDLRAPILANLLEHSGMTEEEQQATVAEAAKEDQSKALTFVSRHSWAAMSSGNDRFRMWVERKYRVAREQRNWSQFKTEIRSNLQKHYRDSNGMG